MSEEEKKKLKFDTLMKSMFIREEEALNRKISSKKEVK